MLVASQGCKNGARDKARAATSDTVRFFPVNAYIGQQIRHADSNAAFIYKITIENGKKDSSVLNKQQFNRLARYFLEYDISDKKIHQYYRESVFMDETTRSYTFDYTTTNSSLPLQSLDVLLDTGDQHVKRVFINKVINNGRNTVTEKAGWKNDESFFINRMTEMGDSTTTQQNIIVWRNQP
jgi:hypothetical protein